MPQVQTARGPVDTAELGQTLMHEHIFVLTPDLDPLSRRPSALGVVDNSSLSLRVAPPGATLSA